MMRFKDVVVILCATLGIAESLVFLRQIQQLGGYEDIRRAPRCVPYTRIHNVSVQELEGQWIQRKINMPSDQFLMECSTLDLQLQSDDFIDVSFVNTVNCTRINYVENYEVIEDGVWRHEDDKDGDSELHVAKAEPAKYLILYECLAWQGHDSFISALHLYTKSTLDDTAEEIFDHVAAVLGLASRHTFTMADPICSMC